MTHIAIHHVRCGLDRGTLEEDVGDHVPVSLVVPGTVPAIVGFAGDPQSPLDRGDPELERRLPPRGRWQSIDYPCV